MPNGISHRAHRDSDKRLRRLCRTALARSGSIIALTALALPATAQAQGNDGLYWADRLSSITVSATRVPVDIADAPATITVITDEDIADTMATDIKDLVRFEPGVSVRRAPARFGAAMGATGRAQNEGFTIRGIGGNRVLIQVDGIRTPQGFSFGAQDAGRGGYTDIGLVKKVEILRGPASALYGSDGLAGVVSFTTSDPEDLLQDGADIGGFGRAQYASADDEFAETAGLAGRSGNLSAMIAYTRRDFGELKNRGSVGGTGEERTKPNPQDGQSDAVLGKLVWNNNGHRLALTGEYLRSKLDSHVLSGEGLAYLYGADPSWNVDNLAASDKTERKRLSLDWSWNGEGLIDYAHIAGYWQDGEDVQFSDEDRSAAVEGGPDIPDRERLNTFENRVWGATAEARSGFSTGPVAHRLALGGDISWTTQEGVRDGVEPPSGETFPTSAFPKTDFMQGGIFLADELSFADGIFTLYPALRLDFYDLDPDNDPLYPGSDQAGQSDSRLSPKIGAVVKATDSIRLFANYAQGFRAPTPNQVNNFFGNLAFGYISAPNPDLGPERSESYEGGVRFAGKNVGFSITGFHADYKDFIEQQVVSGSFLPSDPAIYQYVNLGRVKIDGIEAKADFRTASGITGRFAIAYADGNEILEEGEKAPLQSVDPLNMVAGIGYHAPSGRFGGDLIATHHWRKRAKDAAPDAYRPDDFTILDATAFFRVTDALTLRGGVFNITNETYSYWSDVRGLGNESDITEAYTRPGRNASVSLSVRF
ncbi:TonB-dependent hemoglobin/transferrin/lactoferrin family receptor [Altericroceibacterium spongiae]|uniref:TonB-dependent hemoglobin/transferrin/lactoferrin family receptor n=2 Tax=Altericroceibacterium spongiae TaxID=2320269 RepID=A0A420ES95_9SPHN|nr:TonB-dependent hemoglobin/transferrin/lactoferrin family receptor [Altericroceibacterium spongiae]